MRNSFTVMWFARILRMESDEWKWAKLKVAPRWGSNSQPRHCSAGYCCISTARWPIAPLELISVHACACACAFQTWQLKNMHRSLYLLNVYSQWVESKHGGFRVWLLRCAHAYTPTVSHQRSSMCMMSCFGGWILPITQRPCGATVARLTPDQKVACSSHVRVIC